MTVRFNPTNDFIVRATGAPFDKSGHSRREMALMYQKRIIVDAGVNRTRRLPPTAQPVSLAQDAPSAEESKKSGKLKSMARRPRTTRQVVAA